LNFLLLVLRNNLFLDKSIGIYYASSQVI